jgi:hypothetical protein
MPPRRQLIVQIMGTESEKVYFSALLLTFSAVARVLSAFVCKQSFVGSIVKSARSIPYGAKHLLEI